ncbi:MAG: O-antigen ligase family protein, partial [Longimicrobiales bacterium]
MTTLALQDRSAGLRVGRPAAALGFAGALILGVAVGFSVDLAVALVCLALVPLLIWTRPSAVLVVFAVACGFNLSVIRTPVFVSLPQVLALAMVAGVLLRPDTLSNAGRQGLWAWGGLLFALATLPSLPGARLPGSAVAGLIQLLVAGFILFAASDWLRTEEGLTGKLARALVLGACLSVIPAVFQVVFHIGPDEYSIDGVMRAIGTFGHPNNYGGYLIGVAPIAAALASKNRWFLVAFVVICIGIVLTGSRGALVALAGSMVALWLITSRVSASSIMLAVLGLALIATAPFWLPDQLMARFTMASWSSKQRLLLLLMALQGIRANPFFGYGSGSFESLVPDIALAGYADDVEHPHNFFLHVWLELGLTSLVVLLVLLALYFWVTFRGYRKNRDPLLAGVVGGVAGLLVGSMFGTLLVRGLMEVFVLLVALSGALIWRRGTAAGA